MDAKILCLVSYLLSVPGIVIARIGGSKNKLCRHHARRSLELFFFLLLLFAGWFILMYILSLLIPFAGFPLSIAFFGIVIAGVIFSFALCIMGIVKALKEEEVIFPLVTSMMGHIEKVFTVLGLSEK
ncbi:hypothetical protein FACS189447_08800 [Spirochaetia bacterium]|nr:hypothetical protein FACS189447_08800 [Spirochaetia bacterium]